MENYIVSARKYRPATFDSVVGQESLTRTLRNAILSDRLAHAYLFCGSRGVGKTSCARIFAKTINCTNRTRAGEACNECESCRQFNENRSLNIMELDAASNNSVENIRDLIDQVVVPPTKGRYRVFIIDEVHMLSSQAFNAFLKTLEEPPAHAIFILATTEKHKIIPTILSRCQIYDFNRISVTDMVRHLSMVAKNEGVEADPAALTIIANNADGAMRDALSIFDQVAASGQGKITYEGTLASLNVLDRSYYSRLIDAFVTADVPGALLIYKDIRTRGFDSQFFINGLGLYFRDLMLAAHPSTLDLIEAPDDVRQQLAQTAAKLNPAFIYRGMDLCNSADFNYRQASNKQFLIELTLIKLCQLSSPSPDEYGSDEGHQLLPLKPVAQPEGLPQQAPQPAAPKPQAPQPKPVQPTPAPQAPTAVPPSVKVGGYSLSALAQKVRASRQTTANSEADSPHEATAKRNTPYTDADFNRGWEQVVKAVKNQPVLASVIMECTPKLQEKDKYLLEVPSDIQADAMRNAMPRILKIIHDVIQNDNPTIEVAVMQGELPPQFWSDRMVHDYLIEHHPALREFINKHKLRTI
ncbi:MAG: DNA polymerase III subunit gamma/tau [Bacteroidales bacterium]|nr:DNA polymerase III subunit gamma/tau [Bacteroidales bacterium]